VRVPDVILSSHRRWIYLLLHGYDFDTRWKPESMPTEQAQRLLDLLRREFGAEPGLDLLSDLARHVARG
jgi:hypothetical protein